MNDGTTMGTETFAKFVESQQEGGADAEVDWAGVRDEWLKDLDSFYAKIAHFLEDYTSAGSIRYDFSEIELTEPDIGTYRAKRMNIKIRKAARITCTDWHDAHRMQGTCGRSRLCRTRTNPSRR
jgi:hypothetical protein